MDAVAYLDLPFATRPRVRITWRKTAPYIACGSSRRTRANVGATWRSVNTSLRAKGLAPQRRKFDHDNHRPSPAVDFIRNPEPR